MHVLSGQKKVAQNVYQAINPAANIRKDVIAKQERIANSA